MLAEFRITPVDAHGEFPRLVAEVLRVVADSRLQYQLHAMGTTLEGELNEILEVVRRSHEELRKHSNRILIELSIDDRSGKEGELVRSIEHVRELGTGVPLERFTATGEY
ncbi:MAG: thiamine-binding protein [Deltaproteobacteria bacterium]|nr:MAG: thiamine-binding protein [Deltaproteobacteria bacterium]